MFAVAANHGPSKRDTIVAGADNRDRASKTFASQIENRAKVFSRDRTWMTLKVVHSDRCVFGDKLADFRIVCGVRKEFHSLEGRTRGDGRASEQRNKLLRSSEAADERDKI